MTTKNENKFIFILPLLITTSALAQSEQEQQVSSNEKELEVIMVTAQKRSQPLQEVPIAVTTFSNDFIEKSQINTAEDLVSLSPGVDGTAVSATTPRINIRGISTEDFGAGSDPSLGFYVDGVYLGRGVSSINDIFDIQSIEISKGPQGSLFGRNTTAGAVSITTMRPVLDEYESRASLEFGNYSHKRFRGSINIPVSDDFSLRVATTMSDREGYIENVGSDDLKAEQTGALRVSGLYVTDESELFVSGEYRKTNNGAQGYVSPIFVSSNPFDSSNSDLADAGRDDISTYRFLIDYSYDFGDFRFSSLSSYSGFGDQDYLEDTDAGPLTLLHFGTNGEEDNYSQEFRISGDTGTLDWFAGVSGTLTDVRSTQFANFHEEDWCLILTEVSCSDAFGLNGASVTESAVASGDYINYAVFADAIYSFTDSTKLSFGLRYSYNEKEFTIGYPRNENLLGPVILVPPSMEQLDALGELDSRGFLTQKDSWGAFQPRIAITHQVNPQTNVYASITNGFKSGGFNQLSVGPSVDEESIWSYETGIKGALLDNDLVYNLALYYFKYDDLQVLVQEEGLPAPVTRNSASSNGTGLEIQATYKLTDTLSVASGLAIQNGEYDNFSPAPGVDFSGNSLVRTPDVSGHIVLDYIQPLQSSDFFARVEYSYRDDVFFTPENLEVSSQEAYSLVNASVGFDFSDGAFTIALFVQNLTDEEYLVDVSQTVPGLIEFTQRGEPRFYGIRLSKNY